MVNLSNLFSVRTVPCFGDHTYTEIVWRDLVYHISHPHPKGNKNYVGHIKTPPRCVNNYYYEGGEGRWDTLEKAIEGGKMNLLTEISFIYKEIHPYIQDLRKHMTDEEIKKL